MQGSRPDRALRLPHGQHAACPRGGKLGKTRNDLPQGQVNHKADVGAATSQHNFPKSGTWSGARFFDKGKIVSKNPDSVSVAPAGTHTIHLNFPPSFGVGPLSGLIELSVKTVQTYRCTAKHRLPPACTPEGAKNPVWLLTDVLDWLARNREPATAPPPSTPRAASPPNSLRRRPTLVEVEAARAAGYTNPGAVAAHRAAQAAREGAVK